VANDLTGRRKRGMPEKKTAAGIPQNPFKPGTAAFGQEAEERRGAIKRRARKGDLRVQTAYKTVKEAADYKRKIASGD
jgi:hypothetical protein